MPALSTRRPLLAPALLVVLVLASCDAPRGRATSEVASTDAPSRWDEEISARFARVDSAVAVEKGCLSCHGGIETINERMQPYLLAFAEGKSGYECAVCHEGEPAAVTKEQAHRGLLPNPSSMWVMNDGMGCAKCHSEPGALTTLMGVPKETPAGGSLMSAVSLAAEPTGAVGFNHVYRMERALMALETGKANKTLMSNGLIPKGDWRYANFDMDDPDGPVPAVGSERYKEWIARALGEGVIERLDSVQAIPTLEEGTALFGDAAKAGFADMHRKQCGRCHVWGEGRGERGDHRAGGCAACHVLYNNDARYEGGDPTIPKDRTGHMMRHEIAMDVPAEQCTHCHTRGKRIGTTFTGLFEHSYVGSHTAGPYDESGDPQTPLFTKDYNVVRADVHAERGMECGDCHTSIDLHGDGNIYPVTFFQVEVGCGDCHGTPQAFPWELPVGWGTPVELPGQRGTVDANGSSYLVTTRGNARTRWIREGTQAFIVNRDGTRREIPLLKARALSGSWKTQQGHVAMEVVSQHMDKLECYACHSTWAPQCFGCHIKYDARKPGTDWPLSAMRRDSVGKQVKVRTPGDIAVENVGYMRWESPILAVNYKGRVAPVAPGCQVAWTFVDENGVVTEQNRIYTTSSGHRSPTLAPLQPHANTAVARTCESCHTDPKTIGYGEAKSRSAALLEGDRPQFGNQGPGHLGDIPTSTSAKPQIPGIPGFPFAWDQLVTRSGEQVQNMPLLKDRPLNRGERDKLEREGSCIACHQYYNTPRWDAVRDWLRGTLGTDGRALTPEQHDNALGALLRLVPAKGTPPGDGDRR